jgi:hypothetical protein
MDLMTEYNGVVLLSEIVCVFSGIDVFFAAMVRLRTLGCGGFGLFVFCMYRVEAGKRRFVLS